MVNKYYTKITLICKNVVLISGIKWYDKVKTAAGGGNVSAVTALTITIHLQ